MAARTRAATRVLAALLIHGKRGRAGIAPDFAWLEGMLGYIERTVVGVHFAIEETYLLSPLAELMPALRPKIGRLRRGHIGTGGYCYRMREALGHWNKGWPKAVEIYLDNARDHLRLSVDMGRLVRRTMLPAAEAVFSGSQRQALSRRLSNGAGDPLAGCSSRTEFDRALARMMGRTGPPSSALARPVMPFAAGAQSGTPSASS